MNYKEDITQLEDKLNIYNLELGSLQGKYSLLDTQIKDTDYKLSELNTKKERYRKTVELLALVQKATKGRIKEGFENIVTYALRYIYSSDYKFELEFGRRGNLQEVNFNVKTPDCKQPLDPTETSGGGVLDIVSLALRIALLELSSPKIDGFLVLDEPFKHLSEQYLEKSRKFLKAINQRINRQIIMVTHKKELLDGSDNIIEVK